MDIFSDIADSLSPYLKNIWVQMGLLVAFATLHGYAGAWLAVRMLFRPRKPIKLLGFTIFPQGMIPRHRERLANAIGKAVGEELVSQETIMNELLAKDFLRRKIGSVVRSYTHEIMSANYPSLIESLPSGLRAPVLETIASLQNTITRHISEILKNENTHLAVTGFVEKRMDDFFARRVSAVVDQSMIDEILSFVGERVRSGTQSPALESRISEFVARQIDALANSEITIAALLTGDAVDLLKQKASEQIAPITHHLSDLAAAERTRDQISALIKREVNDYYENLPFFKKIFVSRETLLGEVDDLVNDSLPKRIEEMLNSDLFADEARTFISTTIDNALSGKVSTLIANLDPSQIDSLRSQITRAVVKLLRSEEMTDSVVRFLDDQIATLRPHSIDSILRHIHPESEATIKATLSKALLRVISSDGTSMLINDMVSRQVERLLAEPIGRLSDKVEEKKLVAAGDSFTDTIINAIREKLPEAIAEFDVGGVVKQKIREYPVEKLEKLVLSVAGEHLRTIELFGAFFGLVIGLLQALQFYLYAH